MERPFPASDGTEPFIFACYAHDDAEQVHLEIARLREAGYHIWYEEGASVLSEWSEALAERIRQCAVFLCFVTPRSVLCELCRREVNFALDQRCTILSVHLERTDVPASLQKHLSHRQAIFRYELTRKAFEEKLDRGLDMGAIGGLERPDQESGQLLEVGDWTFDAVDHCLRKGAEIQRLDPKDVSVLLHLAERAPDMVTTDALLKRSWPGQVVGDNTLHQVIGRLRRAFGDDARNPRYIKTLPKRGYRLMVSTARDRTRDTGRIAVPAGENPTVGSYRLSGGLLVAGFLLIAIAIGVTGSWYSRSSFLASCPTTSEGPFSAMENDGREVVAVLPLRDISPQGGYGWLAQGVSTELHRQIGLWNRYNVVPNAISRTWSSAEAGSCATIYIDGSVQGSGDRVSVHLEAIDAAAGSTLWSREFYGVAHDPISLQAELASTVARFFGETAGGVGGPVTQDAHASFLRYLEFRRHGDLELEAYWLEQTLNLDPGWAAGWADLTVSLFRIAAVVQDPAYAGPVEQYLRHAEQTGAYPPQWLWARQYYEAYWQAEPRKSLETIREISDLGASGTAAYIGVRLMLSAGMFEEAEQYLRRYVDLQPFDLFGWEMLGIALVGQGKSDAAVAVDVRFVRLQRRNEFVGTFGPGLAYAESLESEKGARLARRYDEAIRSAEFGSVSTRFIGMFSRALDFEIALANNDTFSALSHTEWMLENDLPVFSGPMLLRLGDSRAQAELARVSSNYYGGFAWAYARLHLGAELQQHPWVVEADSAFGFTPEFKRELCLLATQVEIEPRWSCDVADYGGADPDY